MDRLVRGLAWTLPITLMVGCKPKPPQQPDAVTPTTADYGDAAYATHVQPIEVCKHLARMVAAEAGDRDPQIDPAMLATCDHELSIEAATRGSANWNDIATCVLQARTVDEIDDCDQRHPMPNTSAPSLTADREQAVCEHMFDIVMQETAEELGTTPPPISDRERQELTDECVEGFLVEHRPNLDPGTYDQLLVCLANAQTGAQLQDC